MKLAIYQIDAFTDTVFEGNYAAVVPLDQWLPDDLMQQIARENNLSETAFFVRQPDGIFNIRWFSPITEIAFCGHATLASAYVIFKQCADVGIIEFFADAVGRLAVQRQESGLIEMRFPLRRAERLEEAPRQLVEGLSIQPKEVLISEQAYVVIYDTERDVRSVIPHLGLLAALGPRDVVVTAPSDAGSAYDFVSRYFWPANGGDEDPVTGSIHATLAPLWAERLGKQALLAMQVSKRTGLLHCAVQTDSVIIAGNAVQYLEGTIEVPAER